MADIELVIKIPNETYEIIKENKPITIAIDAFELIKNDTPLPKGHGDLIDRKELKKEVCTTTDWIGNVDRIIYEASVDDAKPIIEADKEDK